MELLRPHFGMELSCPIAAQFNLKGLRLLRRPTTVVRFSIRVPECAPRQTNGLDCIRQRPLNDPYRVMRRFLEKNLTNCFRSIQIFPPSDSASWLS